MRYNLLVCILAISASMASSQVGVPSPEKGEQFIVGRHTFFDFGPPTDFYELFVVGLNARGGSSIDKITLIPPAGDACLLPAKVETTTASMDESPAQLYGTRNPCTIPEKKLRSELKRCKHCLVFSGAKVALQVQCGGEVRIIRADILDKDMFDPRANTPEHTSWTMQLLGRLDQAVGPSVMDRPVFPAFDKEKATVSNKESSQVLLDLSAGKYDALFKGAPDRPSDLYRSAQIPSRVPSVQLRSSTPFQPSKPLLPEYPPLARAAQVEGAVTFRMSVDASGVATDIAFDSGSPLLRDTVKNAVREWRFTEEAFNQRVSATIDFALNCPTKTQ